MCSQHLHDRRTDLEGEGGAVVNLDLAVRDRGRDRRAIAGVDAVKDVPVCEMKMVGLRGRTQEKWMGGDRHTYRQAAHVLSVVAIEVLRPLWLRQARDLGAQELELRNGAWRRRHPSACLLFGWGAVFVAAWVSQEAVAMMIIKSSIITTCVGYFSVCVRSSAPFESSVNGLDGLALDRFGPDQSIEIVDSAVPSASCCLLALCIRRKCRSVLVVPFAE